MANSHIVVDGNAFYEIDDECVRRKQSYAQERLRSGQSGAQRQIDLNRNQENRTDRPMRRYGRESY